MNSYDKFMVALAFIYPITGIPQIYKVYNGDIEGVAILSWVGFLVFVSMFLMYALIHNIKPLIITYSLWLCIDAAVVLGILYHTV